jgi:isoleucyl-tRNA synthetase
VIVVFKARGNKCERCWKYDTAIGSDEAHPTVCPRCATVLNSGVSV